MSTPNWCRHCGEHHGATDEIERLRAELAKYPVSPEMCEALGKVYADAEAEVERLRAAIGTQQYFNMKLDTVLRIIIGCQDLLVVNREGKIALGILEESDDTLNEAVSGAIDDYEGET